MFLISSKVLANVGGATMKPGIIGDPIVWQLPNISVTKENLFLKFYERDNKKVCSFTAIYYLQSDTNQTIPVSGIFYGLRASNIQIFYNDLQVNEQLDSSNFKTIDDLIFRETQKRNHNAVWYSWKNLLKTGFKFNYQPNQQNILKVTGEIILEPTQYWYGITTPAIYAKHPFFNKEAGKGAEIFHYLITPIETWKSVGEIEINVEYPDNWGATFNAFKPNIITVEKENKITKQRFLFKDTIPQIFTMNFEKTKKCFYLGGGNIGFHISGRHTSTRFGWEFGIYHGILFNTMLAVDYETDYSRYQQFCITAMPSTPWLTLTWPSLGFGLGMPIRIIDKNTYTGFRLRTDFSWGLFTVNMNWDYIPKLNIDMQKRIYYGFTF